MTVKFKRNIIRGCLYAVVLLLCTGFWFLSDKIENEAIALTFKTLTLLAAAWFTISICHYISQTTPFRIVAFTGLLVFGVWVYASGEKASGDFVAFNIVNMIMYSFFHIGHFSMESDYLNWFQLATYLYVGMMGFSIWGRKLTNRSNPCLLFPDKKNIIWGNSAGGMLLATDILDNTLLDQVVFLLPAESETAEKKDPVFEKIDKVGGVVIYKDFKKSGYIKAHRHFFLTDDTDFNLQMAMHFIRLIKTQKQVSKKIHLYIRTEMEKIDQFLTQQLLGFEDKIEVHLFSQADLIAREFVEKYPVLESDALQINTATARVSGDFNVLVLGFGKTGYELLKKTVCDSQFTGSAFKATIIDASYEQKQGQHAVELKDAVKEYNLTFNPENISEAKSVAFFQWADSRLSTFNRIIIALGNDHLNITTALALSKLLQEKQIVDSRQRLFVHVANIGVYDCYNDSTSPFTLFGELNRIYTRDILINEKMDKIAKAMNYLWSTDGEWNGDMTKIEEKWHELPSQSASLIFKQESSRAAANGIRNTLLIAGYKYTLRQGTQQEIDQVDKEYLESVSPHIEIFAENEHKRWNAFHFMNGIRRWDRRDIQKTDLKANQIGLYNRHAALVNYSRLLEIDRIFNDNIKQWNREHPDSMKNLINNQQYDRNFIVGIPQVLSIADLMISR